MHALPHFLHRAPIRWLLAVLLATVLILPGAHSFTTGRGTPTTPAHTRGDTPQQTQARAAYDRLPLAFEENRGQRDPAVRFSAHGRGYALALTPTEALLSLAPPTPASPHDQAGTDVPALPLPTNLHFRFPGANPAPTMHAEQPLPGVVNSFIGNDPTQWHTNIPTAARVRYADLYPGIDLTVYGTDGDGIEYDVIVAPGADPASFALSVAGAEQMTLDDTSGAFVMQTAAGVVRQHAPVLFQEVGGERRSVTGGYAMRDDGTVGFVVGAYDRALPLVIDPMLVYSTYLGGSNSEFSNDIAIDTNGNAYVTGFTSSTNFPVTNGSTYGGGTDAIVTKLSATGFRLYSTYLGGSGQDIGAAIGVDTSGNAYVTGFTNSTNFPVTNGSTWSGGANDGFVTALNGTGGRIYSTYFGVGTFGRAQSQAIAVDGSGNAYVAGYTESIDFPVTNGSMLKGSSDAFVAKLNATGTVVYSIYLGGSSADVVDGIAVDRNGNAYVAGSTSSTDFPVTDGSTLSDGAFVAKLNAIGAVVYGTYLHSPAASSLTPTRIAVDTHGNAYVTGYTGIISPRHSEAFVTKLDGSGTLVYGVFLGGSSGANLGYGIATDTNGNVYVTGRTQSPDFPVTNGSKLNGTGIANGNDDAFVTEMDGSGAVVYSTFLGGSGDDNGYGIAVDTGGNIYVTGETLSTDFPVTNGSTFSGGADIFITKIGIPLLLAISPATLPNGAPGTPYSQTIIAGGGTFPYSFAALSGTLPPGLTLAPTGVLSGTPTTAGSFMFTVTATDHFGVTGSRAYTIVVGVVPNPLPPSAPTGPPAGQPVPQPRPQPSVPVVGAPNPLPGRRP